jgi:hypothetical protein
MHACMLFRSLEMHAYIHIFIFLMIFEKSEASPASCTLHDIKGLKLWNFVALHVLYLFPSDLLSAHYSTGRVPVHSSLSQKNLGADSGGSPKILPPSQFFNCAGSTTSLLPSLRQTEKRFITFIFFSVFEIIVIHYYIFYQTQHYTTLLSACHCFLKKNQVSNRITNRTTLALSSCFTPKSFWPKKAHWEKYGSPLTGETKNSAGSKSSPPTSPLPSIQSSIPPSHLPSASRVIYSLES